MVASHTMITPPTGPGTTGVPTTPGPPETGVYLDHAATTPLRPEVWEAMGAVAGRADFNPASPHRFGGRSSERLEAARAEIAACLGAERAEVVFTSGGTASDNLALLGFCRSVLEAGDGRVPRLIVSEIEHKAVLRAAERAAREGAELRRVPVDPEGVVRLAALERLLSEQGNGPTLVSIMWANNEVGSVQPIRQVSRLAREHGARLHTDAVQAFGKCQVSVGDPPVDLLTLTAHKLGGPVGIGALYVRRGVPLSPVLFGGTQERSLWPGTQNPLAAAGFARAVRLADAERPERVAAWRQLRDRLEGRILDEVPGARIHAAGAAERLPHVLSVGIPGADAASLLVGLDAEGIAVSTGSACSSGSAEPSHVLAAMGAVPGDGEAEYAVLRFSFGVDTTAAHVDRAADVLVRLAGRLRRPRGP